MSEARRSGVIFYWTAIVISVLIVVAMVVGYASNASEGEPIIPIIPLLIAGAIWLMGCAFRNALAAH